MTLPVQPVIQPGQQQQQVAPQQPQPQYVPQQPQVQQQPTVQYGLENLPPQPQPQQPAQQFPQQQQPVPQPQMQPLPQQPQQQQGINPAVRIAAGPGVPQELIGRTYGEAMQIYSAMRHQYLQNIQQPQNGQQAQQPQAQAQQQQPAPQQQRSLQFWNDPVGTFEQMLDQRLQNMAAPQQVEAARGKIAQLPNYAVLEPAIMNSLRGMPPAQLANEATWFAAYKLALGDAVVSGQLSPAQLQQRQQPQPGPQQQYVQPQAQQFQPLPMPNMQQQQVWQPAQPQQFFTEQPANLTQTASGMTFTPAEVDIAQKMGMTLDAYGAWRGGVSRV